MFLHPLSTFCPALNLTNLVPRKKARNLTNLLPTYELLTRSKK